MRLSNKVVIVTGAGRGIGKAIALRFAEEGADVVVCSRSSEELAHVADEIEKKSRKVLSSSVDISEEEEVKSLIKSTIDTFGHIDILVNNAGMAGPSKTIMEMSLQQWNDTISINLTGAFLCTKYVLPHMVEKQYGKIINISSVAGKQGLALVGDYCASKAGLISLTETTAAEVGRMGVHVNAICPGAVETRLLKEGMADLAQKMGLPGTEPLEEHFIQRSSLGRFATDAEIAQTALFLASDDSTGITGETITVSAGVGTY